MGRPATCVSAAKYEQLHYEQFGYRGFYCDVSLWQHGSDRYWTAGVHVGTKHTFTTKQHLARQGALNEIQELLDAHLGPYPNKDECDAAARAVGPELLQALKYARRFLKPDDHDVAYIDDVISKGDLAARVKAQATDQA